MSQSGFTPIQLYRSSTAAAVPTAGNLVAGELAINTTDEKLYFENASGVVKLLASSAATGGTFTTIANGLGAVGTPSYTFTGDLNTGIWSPAADTIAFSEGGVEAMRLDSSGNLGIGTTAPARRLHVVAADGVTNSLFAGASYALRVQSIAATGTVVDAVNNTEATYQPLLIGGSQTQFMVSGAEKARLVSDHFLLGTTANPSVLNTSVVIDSGANSLGGVVMQNNTTGRTFSDGGHLYMVGAEMHLYNAENNVLMFGTNNTERMRITSDGNVGIGTNSPAYRLDVASGDTTASIGYAMRIRSNATATAAAMQFTNSAGTSQTGLVTCTDTGTMTIQSDGASSLLAFRTNGNERMRISSTGLVGIGTSAPSALLSVIPGVNPATATGTLQAVIGEATNNSTYQMRMGYYLGNTYQGVINTIAGGAGADLLLNPSGGSVVIGSNLPRSALNVSRDSSTASVGASASIVLSNRSTAINGTIMGGIFANTFRDVADPHYSAGIWFTRNQTAGNAASSSDIVFATIDPYNEVNVMPPERMRVTAAGLVGIGTTAPNAEFVVSGTGNAGRIIGYRNAVYLKNSNPSSNQSNAIVFGSNGTGTSCSIINDIQGDGSTINRLDVYAGSGGGVFLGNGATAWAAVSDERAKDIIEPISNAVQKVGTLRAVIGKYKTDAEGTRRSFLIAQDVQAVLPEAVNVGTDEQQTLGVAYTDTIPLLVAAIKELTARVAQLEGK